jgi:hypothetical protein
LVETHSAENIYRGIYKSKQWSVSLGSSGRNHKAASNKLVHAVVARRIERAQLRKRPTRIGDHNAFTCSCTA